MDKSIKNPHIFCLESLWYETPEISRQSVLPILEMLERENHIKVAHLNCNTLEEFKHNLTLANRKYGILYLAFHGQSGKIEIQGDQLTLDELAEYMGKEFRNCGIHLSCCSTINVSKKVILNFMENTEVKFVSGYKKDVYWMSGAAVDLVYLDCLIENIKRNPIYAVDMMKTQIIPSAKTLGFTFIN